MVEWINCYQLSVLNCHHPYSRFISSSSLYLFPTSYSLPCSYLVSKCLYLSYLTFQGGGGRYLVESPLHLQLEYVACTDSRLFLLWIIRESAIWGPHSDCHRVFLFLFLICVLCIGLHSPIVPCAPTKSTVLHQGCPLFTCFYYLPGP